MFVCISAHLEPLGFSDVKHVNVRLNCSLSVLVISSMHLLPLLNDRVNPDTLSELCLGSLCWELRLFFVLEYG